MCALTVAAIAYVVAGAVPAIVVARAAFVIEGVAVAFGNVATQMVRQLLVPEALLGRVGNASSSALCLSARPWAG